MEQLAYSSIPAWARPGAAAADGDTLPTPTAGLGRSHLLVGIGPAAADVIVAWADRLGTAGLSVEPVVAETVAEADASLRGALEAATVGVRLLLAGPAGACLALRATAVMAGLDDDEIGVLPCGSGPIDVHCAHCGAVTSAIAAIDDVVACDSCGLNLLVYYHVSRRTGRYLGYMVDAETANSAASEHNSLEPEREGVG